MITTAELSNPKSLTELAAKAIGISPGIGGGLWCPKTHSIFDPINDDGDAFRLAIKLGFVLDFDEIIVKVKNGREYAWRDETCDNATLLRMSVVFAAANLAKVAKSDNP